MTYRPSLKALLLDQRTPPVTPHAKDEEWNDKAGMSGTVNGLDPSWSVIGNTLSSAAVSNGRAVLTFTSSGTQTGNQLAGYAKTQPATPYTVTCEVAFIGPLQVTGIGIGFRDHVSGKMWAAQLYQDAVTSVDEYRRVGFSTKRYASHTSVASSGAGFVHAVRSLWMQITNDGSNLLWAWSVTGVAGTFENVVTESYATALVTPTQFMVYVDPSALGRTARGQFGPVRVT